MDPRDLFIEGKLIHLKCLTEKDIDESGWYGWFNSSKITEYLDQRRMPNTSNDQKNYLKNNIQGSQNKIQLGIVPKDGNQIVGVVSLSNIDWINRKAEFGIVIDDKFWGKGFGTEATQLIVKHGFQQLNLHRIYLGVQSTNTAAIESYKRAGFVQEGLLVQNVFINGTYVDTVQMAILAPEKR